MKRMYLLKNNKLLISVNFLSLSVIFTMFFFVIIRCRKENVYDLYFFVYVLCKFDKKRNGDQFDYFSKLDRFLNLIE